MRERRYRYKRTYYGSNTLGVLAFLLVLVLAFIYYQAHKTGEFVSILGYSFSPILYWVIAVVLSIILFKIIR